MLQNFGNIIVIRQDFVMVWQNTLSTVCHSAMACLLHWCCWSVARWCSTTKCFENGV